MKGFTAETARSSVEEVLTNKFYGKKLKQGSLEALENSSYGFLFIFDGYDEMMGGGCFSPYLDNQLNAWGSKAQALVACRIEYLAAQDELAILGPGRENNHAQCQTWYVAPFDHSQVKAYLKKQADENQLHGIAMSDDEDFLKKTPGLATLVRMPFLMKIFIEADPTLKVPDLFIQSCLSQPR